MAARDSSVALGICANASWVIPEENLTSAQVSAAFLLLIMLVGLPCNLLAAAIIVKDRLYKQPTIILLLNLVITDLLWLLLVMPFEVSTGISGEYDSSTDSDEVKCRRCKTGVIASIFTSMALFTISFMSFDRFLFIYKPLKYNQLITGVRVVIVLAVLWLFSILKSILPLVGFGSIDFNASFLSCGPSLESLDYIIFLIVLYLVPIILLIIFNIWVAYIVQRNIRTIYRVRHSLIGVNTTTVERKEYSGRMKKQRNEKQLHMVRVFGGLIVANLVSWLPLVFGGLFVVIGGKDSVSAEAFYAINVLFALQVVTHPLVEMFVIKDVREPLKKIALCYCIRKRSRSDYGDLPGETDGDTCCGCSADHAILTKCHEMFSLVNSALFHHHPSSQSASSHHDSHVGEGGPQDGLPSIRQSAELEEMKFQDENSPKSGNNLSVVSSHNQTDKNIIENRIRQCNLSTEDVDGDSQDPPMQSLGRANIQDPPTQDVGETEPQGPLTQDVGGAESQGPPTQDVGGAESQGPPTQDVGGAESQGLQTQDVGGTESGDLPTQNVERSPDREPFTQVNQVDLNMCKPLPQQELGKDLASSYTAGESESPDLTVQCTTAQATTL